MANGEPQVLNSLLKIWGPVVLFAGALVVGAQATIRLSYAESRIDEIRKELKEVRAVQSSDDKEVRNALGRLQLNVAAICVKIGADCPR